MRYGALLLLTLGACVYSPEPQGDDKRGVVVAHLAFVQWTIGPYWEPPGDQKELKAFDDQLDQLIDGSTGHDNKN